MEPLAFSSALMPEGLAARKGKTTGEVGIFMKQLGEWEMAAIMQGVTMGTKWSFAFGEKLVLDDYRELPIPQCET